MKAAMSAKPPLLRAKSEGTVLAERQLLFEDKLSFVLGVVNFGLIAVIAVHWPQYFFIWHFFKVIVLFTIRQQTWKKKRMHYYMFDFCYLTNYLAVALISLAYLRYAFGFETFLSAREWHPYIFRIGFCWACGPLTLSVMTFRNSMVFHSIDHITSLFMHTSPAIMFWTLRHYHEVVEEAFPGLFYGACPGGDCSVSLFEMTLGPVPAFLLLYSVPYFLFIFVLRDKHIQEQGYDTLYAYEVRRKGPLYAICKMVSSDPDSLLSKAAYMLTHFLLAFVAWLPTYICWSSFELHSIFLLFVVGVSIWNGASYQFHVFSKRYVSGLEQRAKTLSDQKKTR